MAIEENSLAGVSARLLACVLDTRGLLIFGAAAAGAGSQLCTALPGRYTRVKYLHVDSAFCGQKLEGPEL